MHNRSGFTMLEVLVVMIMLSSVIALMIGIQGQGSSNRQAQSSAMKLLNDFGNIEMAFNTYNQEKLAIPTGLDDATFVPNYLFSPKVESSFNTPAASESLHWVDGYLLGSSSTGNYICAQAAFSDVISSVVTELKNKTPSKKLITNSSCPSTTDSTPTSGTVAFTYWIRRSS